MPINTLSFFFPDTFGTMKYILKRAGGRYKYIETYGWVGDESVRDVLKYLRRNISRKIEVDIDDDEITWLVPNEYVEEVIAYFRTKNAQSISW